MQRINRVQLMPTKQQRKLLKEMMYLSSCVYNMANYEVRQRFFKKEKIPTFNDMQQMIQEKEDYQRLGRSYALPRIQKYSENVKSHFGLIKSKTQEKVGLPKYLKNRKTNTTIPSYLVIDGCQFKIDRYKVRIPLSHRMRKEYGIKDLILNYNGVLRYQGKQGRSEIHIEDGKFYLYQSVDIGSVEEKKQKRFVGVDLGIKRLLTTITKQNVHLIIGSKRFYKQWCHYNDLIAKEQQYLSTLNRKSSRKLQRLYRKRSKYQKQLFDNVIAKFFRFIRRQNIDGVFIGDVKGIRRQKSNKETNRMINNYWSYDLFLKKIQSKAEEQGIKVYMDNEAWTSQQCPECGHIHKENRNDRVFLCRNCQYHGDADVVGARNILNNGMWSHGYSGRPHQAEAGLLEVSP